MPTARGRRTRPLIERIVAGDTYVLLFAMLLVMYFLLSLVPINRETRVLLVTMSALTLLLALHTSHVHRRVMRIALVFALFAELASIVEFFVQGDRLFPGSTALMMGVLLIVTPVVILRRILGHPRVDIETIAGAVDVYLLLGMIFGFVYLGMGDVSNDAFFRQISDPELGDFLYFSFVTLTTVGFGDLTAATHLGQAITALEAVIGSVFLVTLVARLVAMYGIERPGREDADGNEADSR
jgi:hypothetical protein